MARTHTGTPPTGGKLLLSVFSGDLRFDLYAYTYIGVTLPWINYKVAVLPGAPKANFWLSWAPGRGFRGTRDGAMLREQYPAVDKAVRAAATAHWLDLSAAVGGGTRWLEFIAPLPGEAVAPPTPAVEVAQTWPQIAWGHVADLRTPVDALL